MPLALVISILVAAFELFCVLRIQPLPGHGTSSPQGQQYDQLEFGSKGDPTSIQMLLAGRAIEMKRRFPRAASLP
jgi:hypothetical protein